MRKSNTLKAVLLVLTCLLMVSCRVSERIGFLDGDTNDKHFLFIPVSSDATGELCLTYVLIVLIAIFTSRFFQKQVGWDTREIRTDIRDNHGNTIGTVGTGRYEKTYFSQESADKVSKVCRWIRIVLTILLPVSTVCSWIFAAGTVFFYISSVILSLIGLYKAIVDDEFSKVVLSLEKWLIAICVLGFIFYAIL